MSLMANPSPKPPPFYACVPIPVKLQKQPTTGQKYRRLADQEDPFMPPHFPFFRGFGKLAS